MTWRRFNLALAIFNVLLTVACSGLWAVAWVFGFIGDTRFIGHVSMFALVLAAASTAAAALAAWRADVPA